MEHLRDQKIHTKYRENISNLTKIRTSDEIEKNDN